ncbi:MAG: sigma-70 family RNA polymerase sigma factor [Pirellulales bacterium]
MDLPTPSEPPSRLQDRLASGEPAAFAELFDLYGERLYRCARRWVEGADGAEDIVQELFVSLARSQIRLAAIDDLPAYLFTSLKRCAVREVARRRRDRKVATSAATKEPTSNSTSTSPSSGHESNDELRQRLARAIDRLPDEQREIITLKWDGELTFAQIAQILNVSPNTAASRYRYAIEKLRGWLSD